MKFTFILCLQVQNNFGNDHNILTCPNCFGHSKIILVQSKIVLDIQKYKAKGKESKYQSPFQCKRNQFTCYDGTCIDLKARCNDVFDCSDGSDEGVCEPLSVDKKEYKKTFPPFTGSNKTVINIGIHMLSIEQIDELAMTFTSEVSIFLRWRDE